MKYSNSQVGRVYECRYCSGMNLNRIISVEQYEPKETIQYEYILSCNKLVENRNQQFRDIKIYAENKEIMNKYFKSNWKKEINHMWQYYRYHHYIPKILYKQTALTMGEYYQKLKEFEYNKVKAIIKKEHGMSITSLQSSNEDTISRNEKYVGTLLNSITVNQSIQENIPSTSSINIHKNSSYKNQHEQSILFNEMCLSFKESDLSMLNYESKKQWAHQQWGYIIRNHGNGIFTRKNRKCILKKINFPQILNTQTTNLKNVCRKTYQTPKRKRQTLRHQNQLPKAIHTVRLDIKHQANNICKKTHEVKVHSAEKSSKKRIKIRRSKKGQKDIEHRQNALKKSYSKVSQGRFSEEAKRLKEDNRINPKDGSPYNSQEQIPNNSSLARGLKIYSTKTVFNRPSTAQKPAKTHSPTKQNTIANILLTQSSQKMIAKNYASPNNKIIRYNSSKKIPSKQNLIRKEVRKEMRAVNSREKRMLQEGRRWQCEQLMEGMVLMKMSENRDKQSLKH